MSLNGPEPVSAFAIYKKLKKIKSKSFEELPVKKSKLKLKNVQTNHSTVEKTTSSNVIKQNGIPKTTKKAKKKVKKIKKQISLSHIEDDEPPPLLIPIDENLVKTESVSTQSTSFNDASISELLSELNKTDPSPDGLKLFKWLIASLPPQSFFENYWEKKALHLQRNKKTYYRQILTTEKLDMIFREFPVYYTRNVDVVSYENGIKEVHNQEGRVAAAAICDYYNNGCSIRLLNPQTYDQKVHLLIATLQEYFGTMVGANVYLTPPGSQGFAPHYDDIEAFILQLEGRKHWKLYKPL